MSDLAVPASEHHANGMTAPVLSNVLVGVVVDRVREMSSMFVGVFCFSGSLPGWLVFGGFCGGWWGLTV